MVLHILEKNLCVNVHHIFSAHHLRMCVHVPLFDPFRAWVLTNCFISSKEALSPERRLSSIPLR